MLLTLLAAIALAPTPSADGFACAVMGTASTMKSESLDYAGSRYPFCCGGCPSAFQADPTKFTKKAVDSKTPVAYFLFDPVSGAKIDLKKLPEVHSDFQGTRYFFTSEEDKKAFDGDAASFTKTPDKEVLYCSVMGHEVAGYGEAGSFADHDGVRYYFCCMDCRGAFVKEPAKFVEAVKSKVKSPDVLKPGKAN